MNKAIERFQQFFRRSDDGNAKVRRKPPRYPTDEDERSTKRGEWSRDPLRERSSRYLSMLLARDVQGLVDAVVADLDKDQILDEVEALRKKHPRLSDTQLAELLIKNASNTMSLAAVASGLAWAVPVVGVATGSVAAAAELVAMIVYESRLVVSVAAVYGHDIHSKERARDVLVCIASSTAGTAVQLGVRAAVRVLTEGVTAALARRTAGAMLKSIPVAGTVAGLAGGAAGAVFNRVAVRAVGRYAVRYYGKQTPPSRVPPVHRVARRRAKS